MSDFIQRLISRTQGSFPLVEPLIAPRYSGEATGADLTEIHAETDQNGISEERLTAGKGPAAAPSARTISPVESATSNDIEPDARRSLSPRVESAPMKTPTSSSADIPKITSAAQAPGTIARKALTTNAGTNPVSSKPPVTNTTSRTFAPGEMNSPSTPTEAGNPSSSLAPLNSGEASAETTMTAGPGETSTSNPITDPIAPTIAPTIEPAVGPVLEQPSMSADTPLSSRKDARIVESDVAPQSEISPSLKPENAPTPGSREHVSREASDIHSRAGSETAAGPIAKSVKTDTAQSSPAIAPSIIVDSAPRDRGIKNTPKSDTGERESIAPQSARGEARGETAISQIVSGDTETPRAMNHIAREEQFTRKPAGKTDGGTNSSEAAKTARPLMDTTTPARRSVESRPSTPSRAGRIAIETNESIRPAKAEEPRRIVNDSAPPTSSAPEKPSRAPAVSRNAVQAAQAATNNDAGREATPIAQRPNTSRSDSPTSRDTASRLEKFAHPESRIQSKIEVNIGRVEINAGETKPPEMPDITPPPARKSTISLEEYLQRRDGAV